MYKIHPRNMFTQGKLIKTYTSKSGKAVAFRYPKAEDLNDLLSLINNLSKENTYITFSGEHISLKEERKYLTDFLSKIENGKAVKVLAYHEDKLIGSCDITLDEDGKERTKHRGTFGITLAKGYRNEGIGKELAKITLLEAKKNTKLQIVVLNVYAPNDHAIRLYNALGFKTFGTLSKGIYFRGEYVTEYSMYLRLEDV